MSTIIVAPKWPKLNKPPDFIYQYIYFHLNILNLHLNVCYQVSPKISYFSIINLIFVLHTQLHNKFIVSLKCYLLIEKKTILYNGVFFDTSRAFNRVWHEGFKYKLKKFLHPTYFYIIKSYHS